MKAIVVLLTALPLLAHDPITTKLTWTRDISRLVNRRCITCHDENASVPLANYEQARPWAKAMRDQVMTRRMPPWGAVRGYGVELQGDPSLTVQEIETMVRWVEGGAPYGDEALLPRARPPAPPPLPVLTGQLFQRACNWTVPADFTLKGIRPMGIGLANQMQITLSLPGGGVLPVIWIREFPAKSHDFVLVRPLRIPRGSTLHIRSDVAASAEMALSPTSAWLRLPKKAIRKQTQHCSTL